MLQKSAIVSVHLSVKAYKQGRGQFDRQRLCCPLVDPALGRSPNLTVTHPERQARETKAVVLRSLQRKSNSGLVKIRDVAVALDHLLKSKQDDVSKLF